MIRTGTSAELFIGAIRGKTPVGKRRKSQGHLTTDDTDGTDKKKKGKTPILSDPPTVIAFQSCLIAPA
jgi:hypothetical protein